MTIGAPDTDLSADGHLAAIVFTDVVGYSARMQHDQIGTMELVRIDLSRMAKLAEKHGGKVLNTMGDGMLLSFSSAIQAVTFALLVQSEFAHRRAILPPEKALEHRIGIHVGDVFQQDGTAAGDGVNVAQRIQAKASPGGICASQTVYDLIKGKIVVQAVPLGPQELKNIIDKVPIYHLTLPSGTKLSAPGWKSPERWVLLAMGAAVLLAAVFLAVRRITTPQAAPAAQAPPAGGRTQPDVSQLLASAVALRAENLNLPIISREALDTAGKLIDQAMNLDPLNGDVWAAAALNDLRYVMQIYDVSDARRSKAESEASRAMELSPGSYSARLAQASALYYGVAQPSVWPEAERLFSKLVAEQPGRLEPVVALGLILSDEGRHGEAADLYMRAKLPFLAGWQYMAEGRWSDVNGAIDQALGEERSVKNLQFKSLVELIGYEDIDAARPYVAEFPSSAASDDLAVDWMAKFYLNTREPEKVLEIVRAFPRDWISTYGTIAPKSEYAGFAQKMAGRPEAARAEWRAALQLIEQRLGDHPNDPDLLIQKAKMLAELGEKDDAMRNLQLYQQLSGLGENEITLDNFPVFLLLGRREETLDWLEKELHEPKHTGFRLHGFARFNFIFDPLRSDPRFQKMMRDTLPAQAKPLD